MRSYIKLALILLAPCLTAATGNGCDDPVPSAHFIDMNLPDAIRHCPYAPKSPGAAASKRQVSTYIIKLHDAWSVCHGNVEDMNTIYTKWRSETASLRR